jgi:hypothetical protein
MLVATVLMSISILERINARISTRVTLPQLLLGTKAAVNTVVVGPPSLPIVTIGSGGHH